MAFWSCVLLGLVVVVSSEIPTGYILQVNPHCGSDGIDSAIIHVITDLDASAYAICNNGDFDFTSIDQVNQKLTVQYSNTNNSLCAFNKRTDAKVYVIQVIVSYGEPGSLIHQNEEEYTVTCTFDPIANEQSNDNNIIEGLIAPIEIQSHNGVDSNSTISLQMTDVLGRGLGGQDVPLGKTVYLRAQSNGIDSEFGLRAVACNAIAVATNQAYAILRAGCGDGIVFKKDAGFTTANLVSNSPYFEVFNIEDQRDIKFECNFTLCTQNCDGSSCANERKRRSSSFGRIRNEESSSMTLDFLEQSTELPVISEMSEGLLPRYNTTGFVWICISLGLLLLLSVILSVTTCVFGRARTTNERNAMIPVYCQKIPE